MESPDKALQAFLPFLQNLLAPMINNAVQQAMTVDVMKFAMDSKELSEFPTIPEAMKYLQIKSRNTFDKNVRTQLTMFQNEVTGNLCCKKEDLINFRKKKISIYEPRMKS